MISPNVTERNAQRMVCGILIYRPDKANEIRDALTPDDFGDLLFRGIYVAAMSSIAQNGTTDILATTIEHEKMYPKKDASVEIVECVQYYRETGGGAFPQFYCEQVKEYAQRRRMRAIADELIEMSKQNDADVTEAITTARRKLSDVERVQGENKTIGDVMYAALDYAEKIAKGMITPCLSGLPALDQFMGGFFPSELTYIAARPSVGKTAAAIMVSLAAPGQGKQTYFASAEMDDKQVGQRVLSDTANVNATRIRKAKMLTDKDWQAMATALNAWADKPVRFMFERNIEGIIANARRQRDKGECDLLMVDYVQLLTSKKRFDQDRLRVEYISHELKALARELDVPVVALAQLNRPGRGDRTVPGMESLADSSALEKDADGIIILHRPDYTDDQIFELPGFENDAQIMARVQGTGKRLLYFIISKQRMGSLGICTTLFDGAHNRFAGIER